jgi:hypothetical protein
VGILARAVPSSPLAWAVPGILYSWWMGYFTTSPGVKLARRASVYLILGLWTWIVWVALEWLTSLVTCPIRR